MCTQSMGFPTYCRVVTAIENVISNITVALVCRRKTGESILTWDTCLSVYRLFFRLFRLIFLFYFFLGVFFLCVVVRDCQKCYRLVRFELCGTKRKNIIIKGHGRGFNFNIFENHKFLIQNWNENRMMREISWTQNVSYVCSGWNREILSCLSGALYLCIGDYIYRYLVMYIHITYIYIRLVGARWLVFKQFLFRFFFSQKGSLQLSNWLTN